jgi:hypothetical protein
MLEAAFAVEGSSKRDDLTEALLLGEFHNSPKTGIKPSAYFLAGAAGAGSSLGIS